MKKCKPSWEAAEVDQEEVADGIDFPAEIACHEAQCEAGKKPKAP